MLEPMTVVAEVWPLAADEAGIWLISGEDGPWDSGIIMADSDMHWEVEMALLAHGIGRESVIALHQTSASEPGAVEASAWTSCRPYGTSIIHTYMAAVRPGGFARETWPAARPLTVDLAQAVGQPRPHGAADPPVPRDVDVLIHGLRHLKNLIETDDDNAAALGELWRRHLEPFKPALAAMYHRRRAVALP
jgi:hypothetical protein